jgi:hypothetical protein
MESITQVCAFPSPFFMAMSEIEIFHQLRFRRADTHQLPDLLSNHDAHDNREAGYRRMLASDVFASGSESEEGAA